MGGEGSPGAEKSERGLCCPGEGAGPSEGVKWEGAGGRVLGNVGHSCPEALLCRGSPHRKQWWVCVQQNCGPTFSLCCPSLPITHLLSVSAVPTP